VIIDPIYPELIYIEDDVSIAHESVIITHSFIGMKKYTFEYGAVNICAGAKLGYHTTVTPGVTIPSDTVLPKWSVATANGVWLVLENERVAYADLKI
jgi:acetyltransferase-like isoleucine patch superfamily enzyme